MSACHVSQAAAPARSACKVFHQNEADAATKVVKKIFICSQGNVRYERETVKLSFYYQSGIYIAYTIVVGWRMNMHNE